MTPEFLEAYRDMQRNSKKYNVDACVIQDTTGFYHDMALHIAQGFDILGWKIVARIYRG